MATATKKQPSADPEVEKPDPKDAEPTVRVNTTDRSRPKIEIDGAQYEMRTMGDFGIGAQQRLNRDGREFGQLWSSDEELTDDQQKRLKFLLERLYGEVTSGIPKAVTKKLNDAEKADVVLGFTLLPFRQMMAAALAQTDEGAQSSPSIPTS